MWANTEVLVLPLLSSSKIHVPTLTREHKLCAMNRLSIFFLPEASESRTSLICNELNFKQRKIQCKVPAALLLQGCGYLFLLPLFSASVFPYSNFRLVFFIVMSQPEHSDWENRLNKEHKRFHHVKLQAGNAVSQYRKMHPLSIWLKHL